MRAKVDVYLAFGVPVVWVFDPERETVDAYDEGSRRILSGENVLTASVAWAPGPSLHRLQSTARCVSGLSCCPPTGS